jgi:hypothetical protein
MAAGLGFKTFNTGEVLTAGDVNGYLMQGVLVFASAAARDTAITSPQEGQFAYTKDTNGLWYYDGAAWVASGATGDIEGVTAGVGISGGGTSGTVTITNSMATAIDAKGDLVAGTGADTFSKLTVGANNTVLTADSAEATGLKWATPTSASENFTLLNAGGTSLSGSTTTISSISGKGSLMINILNASLNASGLIGLRINTDSGNNYSYFGGRYSFDSSYAAGNFTNWSSTATDSIPLFMNGNTNGTGSASIFISGGNSSGIKTISYTGASDGSVSGSTPRNYFGGGLWSGSGTITSISIITSSGSFDVGTVYVYASA